MYAFKFLKSRSSGPANHYNMTAAMLSKHSGDLLRVYRVEKPLLWVGTGVVLLQSFPRNGQTYVKASLGETLHPFLKPCDVINSATMSQAMRYADFFQKATRCPTEPEGRAPYPYQRRFAESELDPSPRPPPTGSGKTVTAVLGWLWRLVHSGKPTPRRLVYCLPMRVLVEQSVKEAKMWIKNLGLDIAVNVLMGGVDADEWYLCPEKPALLIGTQDMLLSRALNRGYAASRFHWPIDFALLNNDCLWVFDEPQLMANGVPTSAQLAGLRASLGTFGPCPSVWMSAHKLRQPAWLPTPSTSAGRFLPVDCLNYQPKTTIQSARYTYG